jgi:hypothetical protein
LKGKKLLRKQKVAKNLPSTIGQGLKAGGVPSSENYIQWYDWLGKKKNAMKKWR